MIVSFFPRFPSSIYAGSQRAGPDCCSSSVRNSPSCLIPAAAACQCQEANRHLLFVLFEFSPSEQAGSRIMACMRADWRFLANADKLWLLSHHHPVADQLPSGQTLRLEGDSYLMTPLSNILTVFKFHPCQRLVSCQALCLSGQRLG